jgi:hypothetical protein
MVKKILKAIWKFISDGPGPSSLGGILDSYELCGWQKCPVPEKKQIIKEDYSI